MEYFIIDRDVLIRADFGVGQWVWGRGEGGQFNKPILDGKFVSFGLLHSIQANLHSWFLDGRRSFRKGSIDWQEFENKGLELATLLSQESLQRFNVYYEKCLQDPDIELVVTQHVPWEHKSGAAESFFNLFDQPNWGDKITLCFGNTTAGWVLMAILSTAHNDSHIIHLSEVFDPFPALVDWITGITKGESGTIYIDEEGHGSYLTARIIDTEWLELIVEHDRYGDFPLRCILAKVSSRSLVEEFYRRFMDFLAHEYTQEEWCSFEFMNKREKARALKWMPPALDLEQIRRYLSESDCK